MLNRIRWFLGPISVLAFGLLSCTQGNQPPESLRIPEPHWQTEKGAAVPFQLADNTIAVHDLGDRLDFSNSPGVSLQVTSRCLLGQSLFSSSSMVHLPGAFYLFSFLPKEVLVPILGVRLPNTLTCSLEFLAIGADGANHHFRMYDTRIEDAGQAYGITAAALISPYSADHLDQAIFSIDSDGTMDAQLLCESGTSKGLTLMHSQPLVLSGFDLKPWSIALEHPLQSCRLLGLKSGLITSLSAPFQISFHGHVPSLTYNVIHERNRGLPAGAIRVFTFRIENSEATPMRLKLAKPTVTSFYGYGIKIENSQLHDCASGFRLAPAVATVTLVSQLGDVRVIDQSDNLQIELPGHGSIDGAVSFPYSADVPSSLYFHPLAFVIVPMMPMTMETFQIDAGGNWLANGKATWGISMIAWSESPGANLSDDVKFDCYTRSSLAK